MFGDPSRVESAAQLSTNQSTVHKQRTLLVQSHVSLKTVPYVEKWMSYHISVISPDNC